MPKTSNKPRTTYVARWEGAAVGTVTTHVRYTHAVIAQLHEADVRQWAYATPAEDDPEYRQTFDQYVKEAAKDLDAYIREHDYTSIADWLTARHEYAKARVADGFEVYAEQWRNRRIAWFEEMRTEAAWLFKPRVLKWLKPGEAYKPPRREPVALTVYGRGRDFVNRGRQMNFSDEFFRMDDEDSVWTFDWTKVVPVETEVTIPVAQRFAKMPKKSQRELLGLVCDKMIERRAWDEIAVLLTNYLEGDAPLILKLLGGQK